MFTTAFMFYTKVDYSPYTVIVYLANRPNTPVDFSSTWLIFVIPASFAAFCTLALPKATHPRILTALALPFLEPTGFSVTVTGAFVFV